MTQDDKLKILKDILLKDEHEYALSIEQKLKSLEEIINQQQLKLNQFSSFLELISELYL